MHVSGSVMLRHMAKRGSSPLHRVLSSGDMSPNLPRHILKLDFTSREHARYRALSRKAQKGSLTNKESAELDGLLMTNDILTILQSKARVTIRKNRTKTAIS